MTSTPAWNPSDSLDTIRQTTQDLLDHYGPQVTHVSTNHPGDGTILIDFGNHGHITGPENDSDTWHRIRDHAHAIYYGYTDLETTSTTYAILAWLHSDPQLLADARRSISNTPTTDHEKRASAHHYVTDHRELPDTIDLTQDPPDWDRITTQILDSYVDVLRTDLDGAAAELTRLATDLATQVMSHTHQHQAQRVHTFDPIVDTAAALNRACDQVRDMVNDIDDAAFYLSQ